MEKLLKCAACDGEYLHHYKVEVFDRREDEEKGLHVQVTDGTVVTDKLLDGNPSSRRHGVKIYFWCENCDHKTVLSLAQHKGESQISIDYDRMAGWKLSD